jgi:stearoyl-CoA desaturase (delta-9 desaturase)
MPSASAPALPALATESPETPPKSSADRPRFFPILWFGGLHVACLLVLWVGFSWPAVIVAVAFYAIRMFAITAGYHRYFSHRSFETGRVFRLFLGIVGAMAVQKGPKWWASTHRRHHRESDGPLDVHSPRRRGFWWSHVGWILATTHTDTDRSAVKDLDKHRDIGWLETWHWVPPVLAVIGLWFLGTWLGSSHPHLGTSAPQMLVWGFIVSTVLLYHGSWSVNSVLHVFGRRRFKTSDDSRNNFWVALYTFGEGWHNNHHRYAASARQGFYFGEIDLSYGVLRLLEMCGIVWNVRRPSKSILVEGRTPLA